MNVWLWLLIVGGGSAPVAYIIWRLFLDEDGNDPPQE